MMTFFHQKISVIFDLFNNGFLVIKNVITKEQVKQARDKYFSLFKNGEYKKEKEIGFI